MNLQLNDKPTFSSTPEKAERYYKVQIRAWTSLDPADANLKQLAEFVEQGAGVLTAVEVMKVADGLGAIDDPEVRDSFENIRAAERILRNAKALPRPLREKLQSALGAESHSSAAA